MMNRIDPSPKIFQEDTLRFCLRIVSSNEAGVLLRITSLLTRYQFSIHHLHMAAILEHGTQETVLTIAGDEDKVPRVLKQLKKLVDVISLQHTKQYQKESHAFFTVSSKGNNYARQSLA